MVLALVLVGGCVMSPKERGDEERSLEIYGPPLGITEDQVPAPKTIPFTDPDDVSAYLEYYKKAYVFVANNRRGGISTSCCLGEVPNRTAKIHGHYDGQLAANLARMGSGTSLLKQDIGTQQAGP
jgi:hypothetical protein